MATRCLGHAKSTGNRCLKNTKDPSGFCHMHRSVTPVRPVTKAVPNAPTKPMVTRSQAKKQLNFDEETEKTIDQKEDEKKKDVIKLMENWQKQYFTKKTVDEIETVDHSDVVVDAERTLPVLAVTKKIRAGARCYVRNAIGTTSDTRLKSASKTNIAYYDKHVGEEHFLCSVVGCDETLRRKPDGSHVHIHGMDGMFIVPLCQSHNLNGSGSTCSERLVSIAGLKYMSLKPGTILLGITY